MMMRLNRCLALCGLGSRRAVESLILEGRVTLNGKAVTDLATQVDPGSARLAVDGRPLYPPSRLVHLAMNKPKGYEVTLGDAHGHRQAYDLLPRGTHPSVKAVGRLDRDSTGLLLFTNDGDLAFRLAHPSHGCAKVYQVAVQGRVGRDELLALTEGVHLSDGPAKAERAELMGADAQASLLRVTMREGRNRIVRRMCDAIGHPVLALERVAIGPLTLEGIKKGQVRPLTPGELGELRRSVGLVGPVVDVAPRPSRKQGSGQQAQGRGARPAALSSPDPRSRRHGLGSAAAGNRDRRPKKRADH